MKRFKIYSFMLIVIASCKTEAHLITAEKMILNSEFYMYPRELNEPHYMYYINRYFAYKSDEIRRSNTKLNRYGKLK